MTQRLQGKTAFVTAAGQGIGYAATRAYLREGATVIATDLNPGPLQDLSSQYERLDIRSLDVTDNAAITEVLGTLSHLDILFNCAGYVANGTILDTDEKEWSFSFDLNVTSMYRTIKSALPTMLANGGGSIINMSSVASSIKGAPHRFTYGATKAAVIGLTKAIAADFVSDGIRCNAICPGTVETPSLQERINAQSDPVAAKAAFIARQPMGRLGQPEEIAELAVYLGSDAATYTTGAVHIIDGGWSV